MAQRVCDDASDQAHHAKQQDPAELTCPRQRNTKYCSILHTFSMARRLEGAWQLIRRALIAAFGVWLRVALKLWRLWLTWRETPSACAPISQQSGGTMDDKRLTGLIAYLLAHHGGGFVDNTITRDELLSVLQELQALRGRRDHDGDPAR